MERMLDLLLQIFWIRTAIAGTRSSHVEVLVQRSELENNVDKEDKFSSNLGKLCIVQMVVWSPKVEGRSGSMRGYMGLRDSCFECPALP
jgi:hypothetical protein